MYVEQGAVGRHPLLRSMSRDFDRACGRTGRVGIRPESLLLAYLELKRPAEWRPIVRVCPGVV